MRSAHPVTRKFDGNPLVSLHDAADCLHISFHHAVELQFFQPLGAGKLTAGKHLQVAEELVCERLPGAFKQAVDFRPFGQEFD